MNSQFFNFSKRVANDFLQSIVFIDDKAFEKDEGNSNHDFDAYSITQSFAKKEKICAVYNPKNTEYSNLSALTKKADITVLDWQIDLGHQLVPIEQEEEDDDDIDPTRGPYTLKMILDILQDPVTGKNCLKLILVYTGDVALEEITDKIYDKLLESDIDNVTKAFCEVSTGNVKILVVAKADNELDESGDLKTKFKHVQNLNDRVKSYDELPDYILDEFTKMTSGLVSNVALKSITSLRNNTYKILSIYNKEIDPAFLSHRALLPTLDDAGDLLKQSLVDSFSSILDYDNVIEHCSYTPIKLWLQSNEFSEKEIKVKKQAIRIRKSNLKIWQKEGFKLAINKAWIKQLPSIEVNEKNIADEFKNQKDVTLYFTPDNFIPKDINEKFSILTHHKSNYATASYKPKLSLGTIIRGVKSDQFWFCLQQKCDSVRLGSESRRFLFLPLNLNENKFNFLIKSGDNYIKLKINYDTHSIRTIRFLATEEQMVVARRFGKGLKYYFIPEYYKKHKKYDKDNDQLFEWVMDLKDAHAQRVANLYASQLSRVGLDESEWLRKWSST